MSTRRILAFGLLVTLAVAAVAAVGASRFSLVDLRIYDTLLRAAGTRPPLARVAVVAIDDRSLSEVGQWPWRRDVIARLLERIDAAGASVIALDLLLAEPDRFSSHGAAPQDGGTDALLADTLRTQGVVTAYAFTFGATPRADRGCVLHPLDLALVHARNLRSAREQLFHADGVTCTLPALARAAGASGFVNAGPDRDGLLRRIPLLMAFGDHVYPSLALTAVRRATSSRHLTLKPLSHQRAELTMGEQLVPLDERGTLLVRFRGRRGSFPHVSASQVLDGRVPADALRDRIVFVGATALGAGDIVATPFDTALPGIEVHASAADTLLQGDFIATPPYARAFELIGTIVFGLTAATLIAVTGFLAGGTLSALLVVVLWWATSVGVASGGIFLSPFFPTASVVLTVAALIVAKVRHERGRADSEQHRRERAHRFTVHSLTSLVETRDGATGKHARRTQEYARLLATRLSRLPRFEAALTPEYVDLIARLAPLHDIGKVGVPDAILNKPGPLSPDEIAEMRRHPGFGHATLQKAEELAGAAGGDETLVQLAKDIVYTHHERWDGNGYPRGLKGDLIPIGGRIMAVVDVYDALTDSRTYRSSITHDEAVSIIRAGRGTHFDPEIVDAFLGAEGEFRRLAAALTNSPAAESSKL
jgi:adenylate cyclase